jgi:hypothetical protein
VKACSNASSLSAILIVGVSCIAPLSIQGI